MYFKITNDAAVLDDTRFNCLLTGNFYFLRTNERRSEDLLTPLGYIKYRGFDL
jgi:hypothetical protein